MSNDPSRPDDFTPDRPEQPERSRLSDFDDYPREDRNVANVRGRVQLPAIFLIVVGVLNILFAFYQFFSAAVAATMPAKELQASNEQISKAFGGGKSNSPFANMTPDEFKTFQVSTNGVIGALAFGGSIFTLLGGVQMLRLRSYGLAIFGAIVAAIPCISCSACCGLGEGIGIWALVVLMNADVRAAFAAAR
jgi:hypothetical protein